MNITAISLFSGAVDGLAIAAQAAGITVTHHVELDAWCCRVLRMNHPDSLVINADIKTVKGLPYADVIFGGSPCQDFSVAGDRAGFAGERYLWPEMRRIVRECRPRVVIHENVRGGVSAGLLDRICADLESDGYTAWPLVYPASVFGAPHERYRMFVVGLLADTKPQRRYGTAAESNANPNQYGNIPSLKRSGWTIANEAQSSSENVEYAQIKRLETYDNESARSQPRQYNIRPNGTRHDNRLPQPGLGRTAYGTSTRLHRLDAPTDFPGFPAGQGFYQHSYEPPRTTSQKGEYAKERIQALGNAVVWQQALPVFKTVVKWLGAS